MKTSAQKITARLIAVLMILAVFVSGLSMTSMAANTADTEFEFSLNLLGYTRNSEVRKKTNTTPVYFYWTGTTGTSTTVNVRVLGGTATSNATTNYTYASGASVDHVVCTRGVKYSISSLAYESGRPYVRFSLRTGGIATLSGVWSPDSSRVYTRATA